MQNNSLDIEVSLLRKLATAFPRHPLQFNQLLAADAEIIDFKELAFRYLILKTDGIQEEISEKLYEDPFLIGWMAVTVTISDLAAVGADPLGLLLGLQLPRYHTDTWIEQFQQGVNAACTAYEVSILGGDTNFDDSLSVTTTGVGTINTSRPLLRTGMTPGDHLYATNLLGSGSAFAYARYFDNSMDISYQPLARLNESKLVREFASACMDTSDGLFPALSVLSSVNRVGMRLATALEKLLHPDALQVNRIAGLPAWTLLAGPHGEYELLFTVSPSKQGGFNNACAAQNWLPVYLGEVVAGEQLEFTSEKMAITCQPALIANLFAEANRDIGGYLDLLKRQHMCWCQL